MRVSSLRDILVSVVPTVPKWNLNRAEAALSFGIVKTAVRRPELLAEFFVPDLLNTGVHRERSPTTASVAAAAADPADVSGASAFGTSLLGHCGVGGVPPSAQIFWMYSMVARSQSVIVNSHRRLISNHAST